MNSPRVSVRIPSDELEKVDNLVKHKVFNDRSGFVRTAIHLLLQHYAQYEESVKKAVENIE